MRDGSGDGTRRLLAYVAGTASYVGTFLLAMIAYDWIVFGAGVLDSLSSLIDVAIPAGVVLLFPLLACIAAIEATIRSEVIARVE